MACGSGCCKPPTSPNFSTVLPSETFASQSSSIGDRDGRDSCCDKEEGSRPCTIRTLEIDCEISNPMFSDQGEGNGRCGVEDEGSSSHKGRGCDSDSPNGKGLGKCGMNQDDVVDDCCGSHGERISQLSAKECSGSKMPNSECKNDCCSAQGPSSQGDQVSRRPVCCEGKESPCCDMSCIDRIALRECTAGSARVGLRRPCSQGKHQLVCSRTTLLILLPRFHPISREQQHRSVRRKHERQSMRSPFPRIP